MHMMTGAYACHALPPEEEAEFERHLRGCDACAQEVRELEATTAALGAATAVTPRAELRARVMSRVASVRQVAPRGVVVPISRRWWQQPLGVAAAALLAVSVALGGVVVDQQSRLADQGRLTEAQQQAQAVAEVVTDATRRISTGRVRDGGVATVVRAGDRAVVLAEDLAGAPAGQTYQLWTISSDQRSIRSAGVVDTQAGSLQRLVDLPPGTGVVALSIEPAGGSEQPTPNQVVAQVALA